jgi:cytidylate kinase
MIIAIDGPSGAGKSTLGKMLAKELNLLYLDTGAMYRAVGLAVFESGKDFYDAETVVEIARLSRIELIGEPENLRVLLNEKDVSAEIRTNEVGQMASIVSTISEVRKLLVKRQQELGMIGIGCVLDGRDIGTVVFPNADVKFFLTAKPEARAQRRFEEDTARGRVTTYEETLAEINLRDERDVSRADSPLKIAKDAIVIDTSELDLSEVFEQMMGVVRESHNAKSKTS